METTVGARRLPSWAAWTLLWVGVAAASTAAILIRYATAAGAGPLALAFWRCFAGALVLFPFARFRARRAAPSDLRLSAVAGFFLAVHFATWITSVGLTTVASSVLLVSTTPVFTALAAWALWGERLPGRGWAGIGLTLAGVALTSGGDLAGGGRHAVAGNLLALAGGATVGGYLLAGGRARRALGVVEYGVVAYAVAAAVLLPVCLVAGERLWGYEGAAWVAIAALVAGPQLLGHTVINATLRDIDPTTIAVTIMAEPVVATALAAVLFSETPSALVYPGGAAILWGIYLVSTARRVPGVPVE